MDQLAQEQAWRAGAVRTRVSAPDPFAGLRGHAYLAARGLSPQSIRQRTESFDLCTCERCRQERLLPAVQRICAAFNRRDAGAPEQTDWSIESAQALSRLAAHFEREEA